MDEKNEKPMKFPQFAEQIIEMVRKDQAMRLKVKDNTAQMDSEIDRVNLEQIKKIVGQIGWPSKSKVGENASGGAWLLVQHADNDVDFQSECLQMTKMLPEDEVNRQNIAYLEDRVRINRGEPQLYGTQFRINSSGEFEPQPIEDVERVNGRRQQMGLNTLEEYRMQFKEFYGK